MKNRPLGCLTVNGLVAAALMIVFVSVYGFFQDGALFSPGKLNTQPGVVTGGVSSHADISDCSACHAAFWSVERMTGRCLACHTVIQSQIDTRSGLHGLLIESQTPTCQDCHTEHNGPEADLTEVDPQNFPHEATGFSLAAHQEIEAGALVCEDCHSNFNSFDPATCFDCHMIEDTEYTVQHTQAFGDTCLNCHDGIDSLADGFDHAAVAFPLTGKHQEAACTNCHQQQGDLEGVRTTPQECMSCHSQDDAHAGAFGDQCQVCHSPDGWEIENFDHESTGFPLLGNHADLSCSDCHEVHNLATISTTCVSCHFEDDPHGGSFGTECESCHTPDGWDQVTFDHSETTFPLTGAHASVTCENCHQNGFTEMPTNCAACHAEPAFHAGLFIVDCETCHTTAAWSPAQFNEPHTFPLNHGATSNTCQTCHPSTLNEYTCYACHDASEMQEEHVKEGIDNYAACMNCHPGGVEPDD